MNFKIPKLKFPKLSKMVDVSLSKATMFWMLGCFCLGVGVQLAYMNGILQRLYEYDATKLSILIVAVFVWQSLSCIGEIRKIESVGIHEKTERRLERGWFYSDVILSVGMVGTVIGFIMMLSGFSDINFENSEDVQSLMSSLGYGMSTALSTTLVGLVSSIMLKLQFFLLETCIEKEKKEYVP